MEEHFRARRQIYVGIGIGLTIAGITYLIMRGCHAALLSGTDGLKTADASVTVRPLSILSNKPNQIVTTFHSGVRGHSGFVTKNLDHGLTFATQADAAKAFNISPSKLSSHLNGHMPHVDGLRFERIGAL